MPSAILPTGSGGNNRPCGSLFPQPWENRGRTPEFAMFTPLADPTMPALEEIEAALEIGEAELAAGDIGFGGEIATEVQATLARLEAKRRSPRSGAEP